MRDARALRHARGFEEGAHRHLVAERSAAPARPALDGTVGPRRAPERGRLGQLARSGTLRSRRWRPATRGSSSAPRSLASCGRSSGRTGSWPVRSRSATSRRDAGAPSATAATTASGSPHGVASVDRSSATSSARGRPPYGRPPETESAGRERQRLLSHAGRAAARQQSCSICPSAPRTESAAVRASCSARAEESSAEAAASRTSARSASRPRPARATARLKSSRTGRLIPVFCRAPSGKCQGVSAPAPGLVAPKAAKKCLDPVGGTSLGCVSGRSTICDQEDRNSPEAGTACRASPLGSPRRSGGRSVPMSAARVLRTLGRIPPSSSAS